MITKKHLVLIRNDLTSAVSNNDYYKKRVERDPSDTILAQILSDSQTRAGLLKDILESLEFLVSDSIP